MQETTERLLSLHEQIKLGRIVERGQQGGQVTFLHDDGRTDQGTARSVGDENGYFLRSDDDVRDAYLRITMRSGLERFEKMSDLVDQLDSTFYLYGQ